jgi:hypothetical protein
MRSAAWIPEKDYALAVRSNDCIRTRGENGLGQDSGKAHDHQPNKIGKRGRLTSKISKHTAKMPLLLVRRPSVC